MCGRPSRRGLSVPRSSTERRHALLTLPTRGHHRHIRLGGVCFLPGGILSAAGIGSRSVCAPSKRRRSSCAHGAAVNAQDDVICGSPLDPGATRRCVAPHPGWRGGRWHRVTSPLSVRAFWPRAATPERLHTRTHPHAFPSGRRATSRGQDVCGRTTSTRQRAPAGNDVPAAFPASTERFRPHRGTTPAPLAALP